MGKTNFKKVIAQSVMNFHEFSGESVRVQNEDWDSILHGKGQDYSWDLNSADEPEFSILE